MATQRTAAHSGLFASLGSLATRVVGVVHTRVQLLALDIEEERRHLLGLLLLILLAAFCLALALTLLTTVLIVLYWDSHRLEVLCALAAGYGLVGALAVLCAVRRVKAKAPPFASSLAELRGDQQQLTGKP